MFLAIENVLCPAEVAAIRAEAAEMTFDDGRVTAGRFAQQVKANAQAAPSPELEAVQAKVQAALMAHPVFASAARPRAMTRLILSRYRAGQTYGLHVDDALMQGVRTDLSFTLFLSDPDSYDGGALEIEEPLETRAIRLPAGSLILYPSTTLHRVSPVTRGERLAVVGWVQSWIRSPGQREVLFDLDRAVQQVHAQDGKTALFDTLTKTRSNLLRMWAEG
ncbi:Fe2+-dependent dioxygenase [Mesobacterium sp. TK19101]|uniref:Fe2+-dependent dioxygenase n=1 Tax=Mesobacterium hydrothermale TaxID=3111907 RepID=A0ABU6HGB8_9RHOB|nr:Fe2+-dependent dioxygenase [Mesobacterium sp. TK19101]MEC3861494.1 Fe2+-dependent dioxygenase [Mesobacterium sp. TK19101]